MDNLFKQELIERFLQEQQHCLYADSSHKEHNNSIVCSDHDYSPQGNILLQLSCIDCWTKYYLYLHQQLHHQVYQHMR
jgi:hypothetical protein